MDQYHEQACAQGVPCALHHYLYVNYGRNAVGGLPKDECVAAFQYWVDNFRSDASAYLTKEHLMCPMLWCRDTFGDQLETMNHMPTCRWLSDGWYWCPSCSRPETFMDCGGTGGQVPLLRKSSKVRRAMTFFKHFGRRTSVKRKIAWPASSAKASEMADTSRYTIQDAEAMDIKSPTEIDSIAKMYEMARSATRHWLPPELPSRLSHAVQHELPLPDCKSRFAPESVFEGGPQQISTVQTFCELFDPSTLPAELPSRLSHNVQHELAQPDIEPASEGSLSWMHEKEIEPDSPMPGYVGYEPFESYSSASRQQGATAAVELISPISGCVSTGDGTVSPVSADEDIPALRESPLRSRPMRGYLSRPEPICYPAQDRRRLWAGMVTSAPDTHSQQIPVDRTEQSHNRSLPGHNPFKDANSYLIHQEYLSPNCDGKPIVMQPCIEGLRELVFIFNHEWLQRLAPFPDLVKRCSSPSIRDLFEIGLNALQHYFKDIVVTTFIEVFALMHVACASAYILHRDDEQYSWDGFFEHMLAWQHAIPEESETLSFVRVMKELYTPSDVSAPSSCTPGARGNGSNMALLESLRNGRVVRGCSMLLVDLDHERILERNCQLLPGHFASYANIKKAKIEGMISQITQPLQQQSGIEAFRVIIVDIEFRLRSGLLHDPWEVEVALLSDGRKYSQSSRVYQRYHEAVSFLCDNAMGNSDPGWRNRYYATALDRGLAIILELDKHHRHESRLPTLWPSLSVLKVIRPVQAISDSSNSNNSAEDESSANASPVSTRSVSSMQFSRKSARESTLTSPTTVCTDSTFTTSSSSSPTPNSNEARCEGCDKTYTGTSRVTNLQRHLKFDRRHNKVASFVCFEPGCNRRFGRSDNRNQHFYAAHPSSATLHLRRRGAMKRRRGVEDEAGRGGQISSIPLMRF